MRTTTDRARAAVALPLTLLLSLGVAACGSSDSSSRAGIADSISKKGHSAIISNPRNAKVTLTVGAKSSTEQTILGQIYAQALEAAGYEVRKDLNLGAAVALRKLKSGRISGYPEYLRTALTSFFGVNLVDVPGYAGDAYKEAKADLEKEGLTAFPPTPFAREYVAATLRKTNEEHHWRNLFGMERRTEGLVLYGPPGCKLRRDCKAGLRRNYELTFKSFTAVPSRLRYKVLETGQADVSFVTTTDARLASEADEFMMLVDDKQALPAGNVIFVTTPKIVKEAGPDYERTIVEVQKGLTLPVVQELDARAKIGKRDPEKLAAQYLREAGYTK